MPINDIPLVLHSHPATPASFVHSLEARIDLRSDGSLALAYCLRGDIARLRIPQQTTPERTDQLWEHTCFEAFIGIEGEDGYREFNFSPSGQWADYAFAAYRQRADAPVSKTPPGIVARHTAGRLELDATIPASMLPSRPHGGIWQIALCAVVEANDTVAGHHSYWALSHPASRPDFHHRDGFTCRLGLLPLTHQETGNGRTADLD